MVFDTAADHPAPRAMPDLSKPACYPHPVAAVEVIETHISRVFLTGDYAYKLKKPVELGFLDFRTLEARRAACEDELRLNRRLAPQLYLDVVDIRGTAEAAHVGGEGPLLDYAVRMRQFAQEQLGSRVLARGDLTADLVAGLARLLARFHAEAPSNAGACGTPEAVYSNAMQNFEQIGGMLTRADDKHALDRLRTWTARQYEGTRPLLARRHAAGRVREVHGDLHLGNIVLLDATLTPFDCIEFNAALRWNDVMSEIAFLVMDFIDRGAAPLAFLFLDAYLAETGDYEGLGVLRFFLVYRALVRAKVHLMRAAQTRADRAERSRLADQYRKYVRLAASFTRTARPGMLLMHGLTACGKSTVARELLQTLHAIRIRSDVERKRLAGLRPHESSGSVVGGGLYSADRNAATYERLAMLAHAILDAGYTVIVDATFLKRSDRARFAQVATSMVVPLGDRGARCAGSRIARARDDACACRRRSLRSDARRARVATGGPGNPHPRRAPARDHTQWTKPAVGCGVRAHCTQAAFRLTCTCHGVALRAKATAQASRRRPACRVMPEGPPRSSIRSRHMLSPPRARRAPRGAAARSCSRS